jgi:hypothetical protein
VFFTVAVAKATSIHKQQNSTGILSFQQSSLAVMSALGKPRLGQILMDHKFVMLQITVVLFANT